MTYSSGTQTFWMPGLMPNMNDIIAAANVSKYRYNKLKKEWEGAVFYSCKGAQLKPMKKVKIHFLWVERQRNRDKDNICAAKKFIMDGLIAAGIINDDGWKNVQGFTDEFKISKANPGVQITLTEV